MGGMQRVLIVEDEPVVAQGLRVRLERLGHTVIAVVHNGKDAVGKLEVLAPSMVLLDIKLPGLDGLEVARQIMARHPVPIILVTAHSDPALIEEGMQAGVMGYLVKPVEPQDLGPAIALALSRFADLMALRKDVQGMKNALLVRQQVERAKGALTYRLRLSEAQAHKRLQLLAQRERCTLAEAAERVIAAEKFFEQVEELS